MAAADVSDDVAGALAVDAAVAEACRALLAEVDSEKASAHAAASRMMSDARIDPIEHLILRTTALCALHDARLDHLAIMTSRLGLALDEHEHAVTSFARAAEHAQHCAARSQGLASAYQLATAPSTVDAPDAAVRDELQAVWHAAANSSSIAHVLVRGRALRVDARRREATKCDRDLADSRAALARCDARLSDAVLSLVCLAARPAPLE